MNKEKIPKLPTMLLLLLLVLFCGLLLIHTLNENVSHDGLKGLKDKQAEQHQFYENAR